MARALLTNILLRSRTHRLEIRRGIDEDIAIYFVRLSFLAIATANRETDIECHRLISTEESYPETGGVQ
jgi:hypothetical protein